MLKNGSSDKKKEIRTMSKKEKVEIKKRETQTEGAI